MVQGKVEKTMKKALNNFSAKEGVKANDIALFIHTKPSEADPTLTPKYFYTVNGEMKKDENGKLLNLRFTQDILGLKFDMLGMEAIAAQFLSNYFKNLSEETDSDPRTLYIMIGTSDSEAKELILAVYRGSEVLKNLTLSDIFGE